VKHQEAAGKTDYTGLRGFRTTIARFAGARRSAMERCVEAAKSAREVMDSSSTAPTFGTKLSLESVKRLRQQLVSSSFQTLTLPQQLSRTREATPPRRVEQTRRKETTRREVLSSAAFRSLELSRPVSAFDQSNSVQVSMFGLKARSRRGG
jgi:hypothetical protein